MLPSEKAISAAFINKKLDIKSVIIPAVINHEVAENLDIIPSNIKLATVVEQLSSTAYRKKILNNHLNTIINDYDYIILTAHQRLAYLLLMQFIALKQ